MERKEIDKIINSQIEFNKTNSNSVNYRIQILNSLLNTINKNEDKIYDALKKDLNKHEFESFLSEVLLVKREIKLFTRKLKKWSKRKRVNGSIFNFPSSNYLIPEPYGNILIITPWNYPFQLSLTPLIGAVAAGNSVIIKPSELAPNTSLVLKELIENVFPQNLVCVIEGDVETAKHLLDKKWDYIFFTGSTKIGKIIAEKAAKHLTPTTLELGGKSPCVVDSNVDIDKTAKRIVSGKFVNCGQTCIAPDYVLVPNKMKSSLVAELKKEVKTQLDPKGIGSQANEDYGHIISDRHHSRCVSLLEDAIQKGAIIITGGEYDAISRFFAPTVLDNVTDDMKIMQEEIFGPILPIVGYTSKEEVINIIDRKPKPLALYIQSKDQKSIAFFIENTTAGGTVINDFMIHYANPHLPFGGVNNSGIGKSHGYYGFQEFTNERAIMRQRFGATSLLHPPFTAKTEKIARILEKWFT